MTIIIIIIISSSSCTIVIVIIIISNRSTQRLARRAVDEMHVFQKKVFSPRPGASFQIYSNAKHTYFKAEMSKEHKKVLA